MERGTGGYVDSGSISSLCVRSRGSRNEVSVCVEKTYWDAEGDIDALNAGDAASVLDLCTCAGQDNIGGADVGGDILSGKLRKGTAPWPRKLFTLM